MPRVREILKRVKKLEITTNRPVEGIISGSYRSVFRGRGIEFSEVREYVPGDDIRAIDWNVTARFNAPFVKEFIEERDLNVFIVFDASASSNFGSKKSKKETSLEIAASIMFAALKNNDNVGLCIFTDRIERFIRPRKGRKHVLRLLRELVYYEPESRKTDIANSLAQLNNIVKKHAILFILSDCISPDFERPLEHLKERHDPIVVEVSDAVEEELPSAGYVLLEDEETGEQLLVNTSDPGFRQAYREKRQAMEKELSGKLKRIGVDRVRVQAGEPFDVPLRKFFALRSRRRFTWVH